MPDAESTRSAVAAVADTLAADLEALAGRWRAGTLNDSDFRRRQGEPDPDRPRQHRQSAQV
jgi:hypothetical protein